MLFYMLQHQNALKTEQASAPIITLTHPSKRSVSQSTFLEETKLNAKFKIEVTLANQARVTSIEVN